MFRSAKAAMSALEVSGDGGIGTAKGVAKVISQSLDSLYELLKRQVKVKKFKG